MKFTEPIRLPLSIEYNIALITLDRYKYCAIRFSEESTSYPSSYIPGDILNLQFVRTPLRELGSPEVCVRTVEVCAKQNHFDHSITLIFKLVPDKKKLVQPKQRKQK